MIGLVKGFFAFWYDFIVGDSIILAIGGPAVLGLAYLVSQAGDAAIAQVLLPLTVVVTLVASLVLHGSH
jgi:hypothetical protein